MDPDGTVLHEFSLTLTGIAAQRLLGHARFIVFQPRNASSLRDYCDTTYCRPIGLQNERQAFQHLSTVLEALLSEYNTSMQEDQDLVDRGQTSTVDDERWSALLLRLGEKRVLRGFINLLGALDKLFDLSPWALAQQVAERWKDPSSDIHRYVQQNLTSLLELETMRWAKRHQQEEKKATEIKGKTQ